MNMLMKGFGIGIAVAIVLFLFEYFAAHRSANVRAKHQARKPELSQDEIARIVSVRNMCFVLPFAFAIGAWWVWG